MSEQGQLWVFGTAFVVWVGAGIGLCWFGSGVVALGIGAIAGMIAALKAFGSLEMPLAMGVTIAVGVIALPISGWFAMIPWGVAGFMLLCWADELPWLQVEAAAEAID